MFKLFLPLPVQTDVGYFWQEKKKNIPWKDHNFFIIQLNSYKIFCDWSPNMMQMAIS